jgi:hypothetical protein
VFGPSGGPAEVLVAVQRGLPGDDLVVEVRDVVTDEVLVELPVADAWRPFFSGDGRYLSFGGAVAGGWAFDVQRLVDGAGPDEALVLNKVVAGGPTTFTRAGAGLLVTGHSGEVLRLWDLDTGEEWLSLPVGTGAPIMHAFGADERYLYYAGEGGVVRRFPLDPHELAALARSRVQREFFDEECARFLIADCGAGT